MKPAFDEVYIGEAYLTCGPWRFKKGFTNLGLLATECQAVLDSISSLVDGDGKSPLFHASVMMSGYSNNGTFVSLIVI